MLKTWPNCHNRFYSAGDDAVVRLWTLDQVMAMLARIEISMPDDLLWKQAEISPGEWKASGRVMHPQRVVATILYILYASAARCCDEVVNVWSRCRPR